MNTRGRCVTTIPILLPEHVGSEIYLPSTPPPRHPSSPQLNKSLHCFYAFVFGPPPQDFIPEIRLKLTIELAVSA